MPDNWDWGKMPTERGEPTGRPIEPPTSGKGTERHTTDASGRARSNFFVAVRARGILNTMLDGPAKAFDQKNPGWRARWEYCPPNGDKTLIVAREGMGFRVVEVEELGEATASGQKTGPIKVGDLILMAGPADLVEAIEEEDAKVAYEDFKLPEEAYREHIRGIKARLRDGTEQPTKPIGDIRVRQEDIAAPPGTGLDHTLETEEVK
jgi:hypothetical protein